MTDMFDKAKQMAQGHEAEIDGALDRARDLANEKTGGAYADQIQQGRDAVDAQFGDPGAPVDPTVPGSPVDASQAQPVEQGSDQLIQGLGDAVDGATGGRFAGQIDQAQQAADERFN